MEIDEVAIASSVANEMAMLISGKVSSLLCPTTKMKLRKPTTRRSGLDDERISEHTNATTITNGNQANSTIKLVITRKRIS